jgi:molybdopterin converting factor small subunit
LKAKVGGQPELKVGGGSVAELLRELEQAQPDVRGWILDERGAVRRHINVFVNGEPGSVETPVGADDKVDVLPAISGG